MKKSYIKPQAQTVCLFTEDKMLASSNSSYDVNAEKETNVIMSEGKGWKSDIWAATDED